MNEDQTSLLVAILEELRVLNATMAGGMPPRPNEQIAPQRLDKIAPQVASPEDLDGTYGDPEIRKDPPRWTGPSYVGMRFSDCPPDYLESLAGFLDWKAGKAAEKNEMTSNGRPRADFLRKDAARARGWALRNVRRPRGVRRTADPASNSPADVGYATGTDDDMPF